MGDMLYIYTGVKPCVVGNNRSFFKHLAKQWLVLYEFPLFNSRVRASVDMSYLHGQEYANDSRAHSQQTDVVVNQVRTRECEDLSFPKKHALAEVRWDQIPRVHCALLRVSFVANFLQHGYTSHSYDARHEFDEFSV